MRPLPLSVPTAMAVKVVDASALAALLFSEPEAEKIAAQLDGAQLAAPALLGFELANVCLIKSRRHPEQREALTSAFRLRDRLQVSNATVDHDGVLELASATGLTAYDASYLWLARQLGAELVTLDKQLANAEKASRA
ncbi:type II toxin-antitoxin system VapC family toxin [Acidisoma sp. S159]|uniref:type II toxin-antitoxin system VapC family toxin n=1 Tax=Acidisoma sp. S159 TaxID=1747225 RepID=UPI0020B166D2|nr:type II toxin-antitoxin system VapC family toxin [Acidisoma sp. S159]